MRIQPGKLWLYVYHPKRVVLTLGRRGRGYRFGT